MLVSSFLFLLWSELFFFPLPTFCHPLSQAITCSCPLELFSALWKFSAHTLLTVRRQLIQRGRRPSTTKPEFIDELCVSKLSGQQEFTETLKSLSAITGIFFNHYHSSETACPVLKLIQVCSCALCMPRCNIHSSGHRLPLISLTCW